MKFRAPQRIFILPSTSSHLNSVRNHSRSFTSVFRRIRTPLQARASVGGGNGSSSQGDSYLVPGATVATLLMLGALHARRLYDDKKVEEARERGIEPEFKSDIKATFLRLIPLRLVSRCWGHMTNVELPIWLRPYVHRAWARAFHSNLEEVALPLDEYASLREFFVRSLKEGCRPIDPDLQCLVTG